MYQRTVFFCLRRITLYQRPYILLFAKESRVSTLWGTLTPSDGRAGGCKQARFTPGVKRYARRTGPAPCKVCPARTGVCVPEAVARSPPRAPSVCRQKCGGRQRPSFDSQLCPEHAGGKLRYTVLLHPQCERVLSDPLTQADSVPACAGPSCQRKGLQDKGALCFGLSLIRRPFSEKIWLKRRMVFVCAETAAFQHRGFRLQKTTLFSRLHSASVYKKRPYALFCFRLRRMTVYQRSGAPGQPSGGRAGGCE